ncbi:MAG: M15 family metallopeptidase, partial [Lachnospiraceae bacterium]|nr:M15 family metallopeptidase [Lachnospiraceae bacterium]
ELIVNHTIAEKVLEIMKELYNYQYPIEKMILIDEYQADDESSMSDNNTSAFNYRVIAGTSRLSKHGQGLAIDINPRYNPCVKIEQDVTIVEPENGAEFADRNQEFSYKIDANDFCCQLFKKYGFVWGGDWNSLKDYQHFEWK